jgi:hypothetical protein
MNDIDKNLKNIVRSTNSQYLEDTLIDIIKQWQDY